MLYSRCVLPVLALYLLLDEISAAVFPRGSKNKREANWLDQDQFSRLSDQSDLSVGDAGDVIRHVDSRPSHSESSPGLAVLLNQSQHKASDKRRKIAPMDSIGRFQMSTKRNRKDEPEVY